MTVFFRPCGNITKAPTPRNPWDSAVYDFISEATGLEISVDPSVDYEDWMEPVCMLQQALLEGLETLVLPARALREAVVNPIVKIDGTPCRDMLIGRQLKSDPLEMRYFDLGWPSANDHLPNHYAELEGFQANAGRRLRLADMPGDRASAGDRKPVFGKGLTSTDLGTAMAELSPGTVIVKQVYPGKSLPLLSYDLDDDFTAPEGKDLFLDDVGFHFARYEGDPAALLVQEKVTMTHETRFFVIDGKVVTGAACIEHHTPQQIDAPEDVLSPVWEITRNSGEMDARVKIERRRTAVTLWNFAWDVALEISKEAPELDAYTLDVALGDDGKPLVIEMNPAASSGLYAINAELLFEAIHAFSEAAPARKTKEWNPCAFVGPASKMSRNPQIVEPLMADDLYED